MRAVVNGNYVQLSFIEVKVSIDQLTRQFTLKDTGDSAKFSMGDDVSIYDGDELLVSGVIEYIGIEQERTFVYAGRNATRYIVDSYAESTTQFSEGQSLNDVLTPIANKFGIRVKGNAAMPNDVKNTILVGDSLGKVFMSLAKYSSVILTSDAEGAIHIEESSPHGDIELEYGRNVRKREYHEDTTLGHDRYVVVSQSNYLVTSSQDVDVRGSFGSGKSLKVIRANSNLSVSDCGALAKTEYGKDRRKSLTYKVEVDRSLGIQVNHVYSVIDKVADINYRMRAKEVIMTLDAKTDRSTVTLEKV